jgi:glutamate-1-semialdehyde 2,1-aminomutase
LIEENPYEKLPTLGRKVEEGFQALEAVTLSQLGGVFTPFFGPGPIKNLADAKLCDTQAHATFFHNMLDRGFYLPPSQFECAFVSAAHTEADMEAFIAAAQDALRS